MTPHSVHLCIPTATTTAPLPSGMCTRELCGLASPLTCGSNSPPAWASLAWNSATASRVRSSPKKGWPTGTADVAVSGPCGQYRSGQWTASYLAPDNERMRAPENFETKEDAEIWLSQVEADLSRGRRSRRGRRELPSVRAEVGREAGVGRTDGGPVPTPSCLYILPTFGTLDLDEIPLRPSVNGGRSGCGRRAPRQPSPRHTACSKAPWKRPSRQRELAAGLDEMVRAERAKNHTGDSAHHKEEATGT